MIKVDVFNELGNQLFIYAYARALSLEYNEPIVINKSVALMYLIKLNFPQLMKVSYKLDYFNIVPCRVQNSFIGFIQSIPPVLHMIWYRRKQDDYDFMDSLFKRVTGKGRHYYADTRFASYFSHAKTTKKTKHVHGAWSSEKYFEKYRETIRNELRVVTTPSKENQNIIDEMNSCNSVAVHFRKGDFVTIKKIQGLLDICSTDYYMRGMRYIAKSVPNPVFYIFSNEMQWVHSYMKFEYPVKFIEGNAAHEDLRLMYNCKHFIISNSTFPWWGSYLSDNPNKIVVTPSVWNKEYPEKGKDILRSDMILMNPFDETSHKNLPQKEVKL